MTRSVALNYPAAIPTGHVVEVTEFAKPEPARLARGFAGIGAAQQYAMPVIVDLDTGIRYMNRAHAVTGRFLGDGSTSNRYPLEPRPELEVSAVWRGRVLACSLIMIEDLDNQHTELLLEPVGGA